MTRSTSGLIAIIVTLAATSAESSANAADVLVEAPVSHRVLVSPADLTSQDRRAALQRKLRAAARDVCSKQYRRTSTDYYFLRACFSGSLRDALEQLRALQARHVAQQADAGVPISIFVRHPTL